MNHWFSTLLFLAVPAISLGQSLPLQRNGQKITIEPYAPNIVRVTLSMIAREAAIGPGYGFVAKPEQTGWIHTLRGDGADVYKSQRMTVIVAPEHQRSPNERLPDTAKFFSGSVPGTDISVTLPDGSSLTEMNGWQMAELNQKDDTLKNARGIKAEDLPLYTVGASFRAADDEHYYGLGENQEGYLDHRQRPITCVANYLAPASPSYCVPFLVTNKGYGIVWDNPSSTTIYPAFDGETKWTSTLGRRVSFFVIAGDTTDEIYEGYRLLTGATPMLPKAAYGFIQCKQRYSSQAEVLAVAKGYRERHLPLDIIVVDWFYYTQMGQYDFDVQAWPDPVAMNKQLHTDNVESMISVWPRFAPGSRYYDFLFNKGWFEHYASGLPVTADEPAPGKPVDGMPYDKAGSDIDTTNPEAATWWWNLIRDNIAAKGFDFFWADETEPDLPPDGAYLSIGPGTQYFNVYPLSHTGAIYDGIRRDKPQQRSLTLSRDAYLGAQRNGTIFWSSDISPTWDTLRRQIPTGLNTAASGIAYAGNDIGGWQDLPYRHTPSHTPLIDPTSARNNVGQYDDYPELYVRWFEYGTFLPTMRTHGTRRYNEVWSYGTEAQPILEKYLKLRYTLMPYIYSLGWFTHQTGAPFMRALFMDFPHDNKISNITDEYMFGPALLVAPVVEQGANTREVYLPDGADWYNFWTNERLHGGQTLTANAPIDTIPLFVRAGSILPLGAPVESTHGQQAIAKVKVYPGANGEFTLYNDDGTTYAYEKGDRQITTLKWDDATGKLKQEGANAWDEKETGLVEIVR
ncbi:glycoside hydrolase family 31 protein [Tunturiibacter empetritectus]|uniref:Alpha-D-xyloside xylohydrolase n=1 Tax=Tunturiibacter lichenicola TaxID=2051959 RepID=A0A852VF56_9BACT|nr:TIM-barrel domain-containing protein [Edaphobacter lichenicola]NYF90217.1 alpha-D-xyloside xylohydrolase [Edaphobacter lichenicola]